MKSTTATIAAAIAAFTFTVSAFPDDPNTYYYPATNSIYHGYDQHVEYDFPGGNITRCTGGNDDLSTLVVFYFNKEESKGKTCEFNFELDTDGYAVEGEPTFDVFWSSQAVMKSGTSSNFRDAPLGRMKAVAGGQGTTISGSMQFVCPETDAQTPVQFEVVPAGSDVNIQWPKQDGPWIKVV